MIGVLAVATAQEPSEDAESRTALTGRIVAVTLYQGTALVTREIELPPGELGPLELLVSPLPTATDPSSVFADDAIGVDVRSVSCQTRPPDEAAALEGQVTQLDREILALRQKIAIARNEIALRRIRQSFLRNLENFVAPASSQEMAHGVLQADELQKITTMHFTEYESASQEIMKLGFEIETDEKTMAAFTHERDQLAAGPPVTYDTIIYLERLTAEAATFKLNYLVRDCGWSPVYNVRADTTKGEIELEFNALIHQVSGEAWDNSQLMLSTASPTVSAYNPRLAPLHVRVSSEDQQNVQSLAVQRSANAIRYNDAMNAKSAALKGQFRGKTINETATLNFTANESATSVQLIELSERMSELRMFSEEVDGEDISIQYDLSKPINLISRREGQIVPVLQHKVPAEFYHVTVPILTSAVFREAQITNSTENDLLGGEVNVYLDGKFTGRTNIPTIARGRDLTLGFGIDGQLRARRSLINRTETVQGGNRKVEIEVEVVIDNYKTEPVKLRLRERTPFMEDAASLRVALGKMSAPLSNIPDYQRFEKPKGILLWDLDVPPGSGDAATSLTYSYDLEFDKSLTLQDIGREQKTRLRSEFLKKRRSGK